MNRITCIGIDDEPHALELLKHYTDQVPYLNWLGGYRQPLEAMSVLSENKVQLLFLDINLPKMDGMSFFKSLNAKPQVIFTTAYPEYAVEGFEVEATDYLVKPIVLDRFLQACNKVKKIPRSPEPGLVDESATIYVKSGPRWYQLNWADINYIEKDENYVAFHTADSRKVLTRQNLGDVEKSTPSYFCRVHKSFIVNMNKITVVERERISIADRKIPLADSYRSAFLNLSGVK